MKLGYIENNLPQKISNIIVNSKTVVTSLITNMSSLFQNNSSFNGYINTWDTSNVTSMAYMFQNASLFNQPIDDWNTSNVVDMEGMFDGANSFDRSLLSKNRLDKR